jgi:hypothetical protein
MHGTQNLQQPNHVGPRPIMTIRYDDEKCGQSDEKCLDAHDEKAECEAIVAVLGLRSQWVPFVRG